MSHSGGTLIIILGGGVPPGPENPYPISDQNIWFTIPYFRPDQECILHSKMYTLFQTYFQRFFSFATISTLCFLPFAMHCPRRHISIKIYPIPGQKHKIDTLFQTKKAKSIPYFRLKMFENDTLWVQQIPIWHIKEYSPPPPPPPPPPLGSHCCLKSTVIFII